MSKPPGYGEPGQERKGWRRVPVSPTCPTGWAPIPDAEELAASPRGKAKVKLKGLDESLEASHARMARALACETSRLEVAAGRGALSGDDIEVLARLSTTWRTLVQNEPTRDYSDMSEEEIRAKLAEVKR